MPLSPGSEATSPLPPPPERIRLARSTRSDVSFHGPAVPRSTKSVLTLVW